MGRLLKDLMKDILTKEELEKLYSGLDIIGDIAIFKVPDELSKYKSVIGERIISRLKNVKSVWCQVGPVSGEYRIRELEHVAGDLGRLLQADTHVLSTLTL